MKDLLKKPVTFEKVEFWIATAVYVFAVFILLGNASHNNDDYSLTRPENSQFFNGTIPFSYTENYFIPQIGIYTVYYVSFILLNFFIVEALFRGKRIFLNIVLLILLYLAVSVAFGTADTWMKNYLLESNSTEYVYRFLFKQEFIYVLWVLIIFGFYTFIKYILKIALANFNPSSPANLQLLKECGVALCIWGLGVFFLRMSYINWKTSVVWCEVLLYGIGLYWYLSYKTIPDAVAKQLEFRDYLLRVFVVLSISIPIIALVAYIVIGRLYTPFYMSVFSGGFGLFIIAPFTWFLYQFRFNKNKELQGLKTALGHSSANLDFLRSQINPHFLFNALNTLYGTSLQENAERTGGGIQKLGDMMRFMLQENMQEKISLTREIDYLNNYIDLQKLRTQTSPDILIQTEIDEQTDGLAIAPMLLIPFVENAFKHGISLREPSHIKVSLQTRENELFFDVYNSIHPKTANDPEKHKSGIGLENVKQRLLLLYPKRHELVIRESTKEFFIHLTVQL